MKIIYLGNINFPMRHARSIQIVNTCNALAKQGCEVFLLVRRTTNQSVEECLAFYGLQPHQNLTIYRLPVIKSQRFYPFPQKVSYYLSCIVMVLFLVAREAPDVIYIRDLRLAQIFIKLRLLIRTRLYYESHSVSYLVFLGFRGLDSLTRSKHDKKIRRVRRLEEFVYRNVNGVIAITEHLKNMIREEFRVGGITTVIRDATNIYNAKSLNRREFKKTIYYVGQLHPWKGVNVLIRAMKHVEGAQLVIVGGITGEGGVDRYADELKKLAEKEEVRDKIFFQGFVPYEKTRDCLAKARVLVIPLPNNMQARYFTSPLKLFEYMASKRPIVATDLPSIQEILRDGENAILVEPDDPEALARGIKKVLNNPALARQISERAYLDVQRYSWDHRAKEILEFIETGNKGV